MDNTSIPMGSSSAVKSEPIHDLRILRDVKVAMRDGVKLSANVFLPAVKGQFPVIATAHYGFACRLL